jgi:ribosome-associated protein
VNTPRNPRGPQRRDARAAEPPSSAETDQTEAPEQERPSRSARKRQALALQELGVRLTLLKPAQLQQLPLPEQLLAAVLEAQRLKSRAALARQRQYIGKLMRTLDPEPIARALSSTGSSRGADDKLR